MQRNKKEEIQLPEIFQAIQDNNIVRVLKMLEEDLSIFNKEFDGSSFKVPSPVGCKPARGTKHWHALKSIKHYPWFHKTPLTFASHIGKWDCVQAILNTYNINNPTITSQVLWDAAKANKLAVVQQLLNSKERADHNYIPEKYFGEGNINCAYWAIHHDNVEMLELLLDRPPFLPYNAIEAAFESKSWGCIRKLISQSIYLEDITYHAIQNNNEEIALKALNAGAFNDTREISNQSQCQSCLTEAATKNLADAFSLLLKRCRTDATVIQRTLEAAKKSNAYECILIYFEYSKFYGLQDFPFFGYSDIVKTLPTPTLANLIDLYSQFVLENTLTAEMLVKNLKALKELNEFLTNKILQELNDKYSSKNKKSMAEDKTAKYVTIDPLRDFYPDNHASESWMNIYNIICKHAVPETVKPLIDSVSFSRARCHSIVESLRQALLTLKNQCETFKGKVSVGRYWWWVNGTPKGVTLMKEILQPLNVDSSDETVMKCYAHLHSYLSNLAQEKPNEHRHESTTAFYISSYLQLEALLKKPDQLPALALPLAEHSPHPYQLRFFKASDSAIANSVFAVQPGFYPSIALEPSAPLMTNPNPEANIAPDSSLSLSNSSVNQSSLFQKIETVVVTTTHATTEVKQIDNDEEFGKQFPGVPSNKQQRRIASPAT